MDNGYSGNCFGRYLIIIFVPLLSVLFLALNYFGVLNFLNLHTYSFYILLVIFFIFILFVGHNAYIAECKIRNQFNVTKNILEKSLENSSLVIDGKSKSVLSVRDFLDDYFKNIRNDNFAKVASSVFPMLGILGTFIAIAISMPNFTVDSSLQLDGEISKLLSGVGTAFYASIFGIYLSLWWTFFERIGLSKIEIYTNSLEDIYFKDIWSKRELLKFKYNQKAIMDNELLRVLRETFNLDFIKSINREHLKSYEEILEKSYIGLREIETTLVNQANGLERVAKELKQSNESIEAKINLEKNILEFNKSAKELNLLLEHFDNGLDGALSRVDSELAKAVNSIESMVISVKSIKE